MKRFIIYSLSITFLFLIAQCLTFCQKKDYSTQINPLLDKYLEAWNAGNFEELDKVVSADFELKMNPDFKQKIGRELLKEEITNTRNAFPDFHLTVEKRLFVGDSAVVIQWSLTGTNTGESSMPPTGNEVSIPGFSVIFFNDNLLTGEWLAFSDLAWVTQLGFTLTPPEFIEQ
ncbi:MAG: SnoaL-like domain-containing protein [Ignavibacteriaceae bacterium]|nr:SnoaL-like domain-containing protein [Ignavibacteriaceae bacterium]